MGDGVDYKDEDKLGLCLYDRPDLCVAKNWLLVGVSFKKKNPTNHKRFTNVKNQFVKCQFIM